MPECLIFLDKINPLHDMKGFIQFKVELYLCPPLFNITASQRPQDDRWVAKRRAFDNESGATTMLLRHLKQAHALQ